MSNNLCNLSIWGNTNSPSSVYNYAASYCTVSPSPSVSAPGGSTTVTQCWMAAYTTTLKIMGDKGYPWVTPQ